MSVDGSLRQDELGGDPRVAQAGGEEAKHLTFALRQGRESRPNVGDGRRTEAVSVGPDRRRGFAHETRQDAHRKRPKCQRDHDPRLFARGAYITEFEARYSIHSRPGKFRVGLWADTYFSGSYSQAIDLTLLNPGLDPTDAIVLTRKARTKYGYYLNLEQAVSDEVGVFARWSWNDGKNEISAFTDIDASLSLGTSIKGTRWGRPDDRIGLAGAINMLSRDHRDYIAAGGLGILIGDGRLNYRPEQILETFYAMSVISGVILTFDYQFMLNPAYNADRGPISFFSGRLHGEF